MTEQLALDPALTAKPLTERQQQAWDYVRERDGVTADEVGSFLHAHRGKHSFDDRCAYCGKDGLSVLRSKALAPLVMYRRAPEGRLYIARDKADRAQPEKAAAVWSQPLSPDDPFYGL